MQKKLTCYRCKKKFDGDPAQGNLCEGCRERIAIQVEHLPHQLIRDCKAANVPVFVKQLGSHVLSGDGEFFDGDDEWAWPQGTVIEHRGEGVRVRLKDKKGGDMSEWPLDLRVREMPTKGEVNIKNG